jgi:hypothetical protein
MRFVILLHETPPASPRPTHWDLMLESGDVLRTWALASEPHPGQSVAAESLPDHRPIYLEYDGPLSGDRGIVSRWDSGTFELIVETESLLLLELHGQRLRGQATLHRLTSTANEWEFCGSHHDAEDAPETGISGAEGGAVNELGG